MRLCYAYEWDAGDVRTQSGRPFHLLQALRREYDVVDAFPLNRLPRYGFAPLKWAAQARGRVYHTEREPFMLWFVGRQIDGIVTRSKADVVFAPSSIAAAAMSAEVPIVYCADSNVYQLFGYYEGFERIDTRYRRLCHAQEAKALARCAAAIFPSEWAAEAAVRVSGADRRKVHVIPFGANVEDPGREAVATTIERRSLSEPRILFIGSEWRRKGGDIVVEACARLRERGIPVSVDLVGVPTVPDGLPDYFRHHGVLRKGIPEENRRLSELLALADLLFVPSRAECYGMTFCEAAAYGLPSVSCRTGGIPTVVQDGVTGQLLEPGASPAQYAEVIAELVASPERYRAMARAGRADYETRLNWGTFLARLTEVLGMAASRAIAVRHQTAQLQPQLGGS